MAKNGKDKNRQKVQTSCQSKWLNCWSCYTVHSSWSTG